MSHSQHPSDSSPTSVSPPRAPQSATMCQDVPSSATCAVDIEKRESNPPQRARQSAAMCQDVPSSATCAVDTEMRKSNPPQALTFQQRAAARLLVKGARSTDVAQELCLNRHTIARWKRLPEFAAEVLRLERFIERNLANLQPQRQMSSPRRTNNAAAPARPGQPASPAASSEPPREQFWQAVIRLQNEGVSTLKDPAEFARRMRESGFRV